MNNKATKDLLEFWEDQMKLSHTSSNYFFRKSPSHYHMMLLVMTAYKLKQNFLEIPSETERLYFLEDLFNKVIETKLSKDFNELN